MKRRGVIAAVLLAGLLIAGLAIWQRSERRPRLMLASNFASSGTVAVRVDRFEQAWELPAGVKKRPPEWMISYPILLKGWAWLFRETEQVEEGLVWVLVDATVASGQPLEVTDIDYRLDYGRYTLGAHGGGFLTTTGTAPYRISTRLRVPDGRVPIALEIQVKGEWLRFPINVQ